MKTFPLFLLSVILALWVSAIAIVAIQNAVGVSLRFLVFQSIQLPLGLVLAFSVSLGMIAGAIVLSLGNLTPSPNKYASPANTTEEGDEFDF